MKKAVQPNPHMVGGHGVRHDAKLKTLGLDDELPSVGGAESGSNALEALDGVALAEDLFQPLRMIAIDENRGESALCGKAGHLWPQNDGLTIAEHGLNSSQNRTPEAQSPRVELVIGKQVSRNGHAVMLSPKGAGNSIGFSQLESVFEKNGIHAVAGSSDA